MIGSKEFMALPAIERVREMAKVFGGCKEAFNLRFTTVTELEALYVAWVSSRWCIPPDEWSDRQVSDAITSGIPPEFDDNEKPVHP